MKSKEILGSVNKMIERDQREIHFRDTLRPIIPIKEGEEPLLDFYRRYYVLTGKSDYVHAFYEAHAVNVFRKYSEELEQFNSMDMKERLELLDKIQHFVNENDRKTPYCKVEELAKEQFGSIGVVRVGIMINVLKKLDVSTVYDLREDELEELTELAKDIAERTRENVDKIVFEVE